MSRQSRDSDWLKAPTGHERLWLGPAVGGCIVLSLLMPYWHFKRQQYNAGETCKVSPEDFVARVAKLSEGPWAPVSEITVPGLGRTIRLYTS